MTAGGNRSAGKRPRGGAMNDPGQQHRLWSIPGDGVLARQGDLVLLSDIDEAGFVDSLLGVLARVSEAGGDGRALADAVGAALEDDRSWGAGREPGPAVVAFGPAGAGLVAMVSGTAWAEITTGHGTYRLAAGQPSMLLRSVIGVPVQAVRGGLAGHGPADRTDRFSRLDSGTVRACGLSYYADEPAGAAPAAAEPAAAEPAAEPARDLARAAAAAGAEAAPAAAAAAPDSPGPGRSHPRTELASITEATAAGDAAGPIILGVYCGNGHFGDPEAPACAVCGAPRGRRPPAPQPGPRPPLGILVLEDGTAAVLDSDYVIGREPGRDPSVLAGDARPLMVVDAESAVSRIHARIHLDGWQVLLTDLGSANGTRIRPPGAKSEQPLDPQVPVPLRHGTRVFVGTTGLRYEPPPG